VKSVEGAGFSRPRSDGGQENPAPTLPCCSTGTVKENVKQILPVGHEKNKKGESRCRPFPG